MNSTNPRLSSSSCSGSAGLIFQRFFVESCLYFISISLSNFSLGLIFALSKILAVREEMGLSARSSCVGSITDARSEQLRSSRSTRAMFSFICCSALISPLDELSRWRSIVVALPIAPALWHFSGSHTSEILQNIPDSLMQSLGKSSPCGPTALSAWRF